MIAHMKLEVRRRDLAAEQPLPVNDRLLAELIARHGKPSGTRQMIQVLSLIRQHGHQRVRAAVKEALALGCWDAAAIRHLVEAADLVRARSAIVELGVLSRYERPKPALTDYDGLLSQQAIVTLRPQPALAPRRQRLRSDERTGLAL